MSPALPVLTRILSALLALALVAAGVVLVVETVASLSGDSWALLPDSTTDNLRTWGWDGQPMVPVLVIVGVVGLVCLLVGLWPRAGLTIPSGSDGDLALDRSSLEQSVRDRVERIDGVSRARVRAGRGRLVAKVDTTRGFQPDQLEPAVKAELDQAVSQHHLALTPRAVIRRTGSRENATAPPEPSAPGSAPTAEYAAQSTEAGSPTTGSGR